MVELNAAQQVSLSAAQAIVNEVIIATKALAAGVEVVAIPNPHGDLFYVVTTSRSGALESATLLASATTMERLTEQVLLYVQKDLSTYTVEVEDEPATDGFRFRVVNGERKTDWAGYSQVAMLDGVGAITGYYVGDSKNELVPLTARQILENFAVLEEVEVVKDPVDESGEQSV